MGLLGIVLSLCLLMYLAYRGINVLILAPLLALLAVVMSGGIPVLATYTQVFMKALGGYLTTYFPLFMLGAIFGKLMADSGSARAISEWIVSKLGAEVAKILAMPDVLQRVKAIGNEVMPGSPEELHRLLRSEIETRKKIFGSQAGKTQ